MQINSRFILLLLLPSNFAFSDTADNFSICMLANKDKAPIRKLIRVRAVYVSDLTHGSLLQDKSCPDLIVNIGHFDQEKDPTLKEFNLALFGTEPDYKLKKFDFDASGFLTWEKNETHPTMHIIKIWNYHASKE